MEYTNLSIKEIKIYLDKIGIDSSWLEKSDFIRAYTLETIPTRIAFYYNQETNELTGRTKDIRGASTDGMSFAYKFYEYGNVIVMEELGRKAVGFLEDTYYFSKQTIYFDKIDGSVLALEKRYREYPIESGYQEYNYDNKVYVDNIFNRSFEKSLYQSKDSFPTDEQYRIHFKYEINNEKINERLSNNPSDYSILQLIIDSFSYKKEMSKINISNIERKKKKEN